MCVAFVVFVALYGVALGAMCPVFTGKLAAPTTFAAGEWLLVTWTPGSYQSDKLSVELTLFEDEKVLNDDLVAVVTPPGESSRFFASSASTGD